MKKFGFVSCLLALASVLGAAPALALEDVKTIIPRDSAFVLSYLAGKDAGIYQKHGIDLDVDVRPFGGFLAGLPAKQAMVGTYSGMDAVEKIEQGLDWVIIGGGLTVMQEVYVRKDAPFKTITELRGKTFGSFSTGAGSFKATRGAILDADRFDVLKDTNFQQISAPALFHLLQTGGVDAMFNISSLTVAAASQPDKFRSIFSPDEYWRQKTGYPICWAAPIVAWRSWVTENPARAAAFVAATEESFRWLRDPEHLQAAVKKYGVLAGVTTAAEAATYEKWLQQKRFFLTEWDRKTIDAQWQFLELAKRQGILNSVPSEQKYGLILK